MKKLMLSIIAMCLILGGCGHKSDLKLSKIEQFKCQNSIQTVFGVLGKSDIETDAVEGELCRYERLNLWGYNGAAVFKLRDDKDTISSFYASLELDKKEFEDVLSQLKDEYGKCEKSEYAHQIAYVWEIPEDKAEELGYNRISLSDYGDKKAVVDFSDEWSMYKDEVYYENLKKSNEESNLDVLAKKTYNIGDDTFDFLFGEQDGEKRFYLYCNIKDKADAFYVNTSLNTLMNSEDENFKIIKEEFDFSYSIIVGDGAVLFRTPELLIITKDGAGIDVEDYFSAEWMASEEYHESDYGAQVMDFMIDFIENN